MENYKIRVANESESKEAQELFFELGYVWHDTKCKTQMRYVEPVYYSSFDDMELACDVSDVNYKNKEITLPELRALVSLHKNPINMDKVLSEVRSDALGLLEDKEYLRKNSNGTYSYVGVVHPDHVHDLLIEIPKGAKKATKLGAEIVFWNGDDSFVFNLDDKWSSQPDSMSFNTYVESYGGVEIIWQRHTQPEELPFVDDECYTNKSNGGFKLPKDKPCDISKWSELRGESLNDQYAEIEQVRQEHKLKNDMNVDDYLNSLRFDERKPNQATINAMNEADTLFADAESSKYNHYFIDVSDVDEVDFYEIALRYNVTDPCIQHILKKCLAVGNRGHKDFHTDLKDIYDTAARALRIHGA